MEFRIETLEDLPEFARAFKRAFPSPAIFLVHGEMGAGKTTSIGAILEEFGLSFAGSPTFSLVNTYETIEKVKVYHFDLYRLKNIYEAYDIGIEEYLDAEAYIFVEWPEKIIPLLRGNYYEMRIQSEGAGRMIAIYLKHQ